MRSHALVLIVITAETLLGCAELRTYPICFFDTSVVGEQAANSAWGEMQVSLSRLLKSEVYPWNTGDVLIISSTTAVARTTSFQHAKIESFWPSVACYGSSTGDKLEKLRWCQTYVSRRMMIPQPSAVAENIPVPQCQMLDKPAIK